MDLKGYKLLDQIYNSTTTLVYRSIREKDNTNVIIKVLKPENLNVTSMENLKHDFKLSNKLDIRGVVKKYDLYIDGHHKYMTMEDFGGISLKKYLVEKKPDFKTKMEIILKTAKLIGKIHKFNIIHKDIKPDNIIINPESKEVKLIDFGIAAEVTRETMGAISPDKLEGTLAYIAPEQTGRMNRSIDYRSDYYSLGITMYRLFTGKLPFESTDPMELVHSHIAIRAKEPSITNPSIPKTLSQIIMKLMAKTAETRYQSVIGLIADIEQCFKLFNETGEIKDFTIGQKDVSERFHIPEKLYGRENEISHLLNTFAKISTGEKDMVYYRGVSGIGKSALINEIHKPMIEKKGYFISGKYDQFKRNMPYIAIIQAFQELSRHLITESDYNIEKWKREILDAVRENGIVITDVIPGMKLIIGEQPEVPELPATEAQNRFKMVFQNFIQVFATKNHPLVMFIDDLQWADNASLQLLEVLLGDEDLKYFLFIGAYRDNEVENTHPLSHMFQNMKKEGFDWEDIKIQALSEDHINNLLSDTLYCDKSESGNFAKLIKKKTGGNPFFVTEFLKTLYNQNLIGFSKKWTWELPQIDQAGITDNVVELMADKIKKLSSGTLNILKIASVIGNIFYVDTLAEVYGKSEDDTYEELKESINEGMILHLEDNFKFVHDKVQEGSYSLLKDDERKKLHYRIGKKVLENAQKNNLLDERLFSIVNHLNLAKEHFTEDDKKTVLQLNIQAGQKAKVSAAYDAAVEFFSHSYDLLSDDSWINNYKQTLLLYTELAESELLTINYDRAEELFDVILNKANTVQDKIAIFSFKISFFTGQSKPEEAIDVGRKALKQLGISIPKKISQITIIWELVKVKNSLSKIDILSLKNAPIMKNEKKIAAMDLLMKCSNPAYFIDLNLAILITLKMMKLTLKYGNNVYSSWAYSAFAIIIIGVLDDIKMGLDFGELCLLVSEKFGNKQMQGYAMFHYSWFCHWIKPLKESLNYTKKAFATNTDTGELQFIALSSLFHIYICFFDGENLNHQKQTAIKFSHIIKRTKQPLMPLYVDVWLQTISNLLGEADNFTVLTGIAYNEKESITELTRIKSDNGLVLCYQNKALLLYLYEDYSKAVYFSNEAEKKMLSLAAQPVVQPYLLYIALSYSAFYLEGNKKDSKKYLNNLKKINKKFKKWSQIGPNHKNKYYLISAELAQIQKKYKEAETLYDKAIKSSSENGFIMEEAIANECAARFYLVKDSIRKASKYLTEAYYCYKAWGCKPKTEQLLEKYPSLIKLDEKKTSQKSSESTASSTTESGALDINTIMKATQTISGEIKMDNLLKKMIHIVIENAGATKGVLVLVQENDFFIEAESGVGTDEINVLKSIPIEESSNLSAGIIRYVSKTRENLVLQNASEEDLFKSDKYMISQKPKSLLCVPIFKQNNLIGLVYLENNLTSGAFTEERVKTLNILSSQIAISIENARLIEEMKESERLKQEMEIAERIQTSLLPETVDTQEFEIVGAMETADEVGGDYYDFRNDSNGNLWLAIGDVSGHGVTPGMFMMMAQTSLSSILYDSGMEYSPAEVVTLINKTLYDNVNKRLKENHFMTFNLLKYLENGEFIQAGCHLDIIIYRDETKKCDLIETSGIFLNLLEDISSVTTETKFKMEKNDLMVLYTDGVIESRNKEEKLLDMDGLVAIIEKNGSKVGVGELKDIIVGETLNWCNHKPADDISLVVIKRL